MLSMIVGTVFLFAGHCTASRGSSDEDKTQPKLVLRFATEVKPENKVWDAARLITENLRSASTDGKIKAGEIKVEFYDRGMLGSDRKVLEACYFGVVEMVMCTSSVVTTVDPTFSLLDMPYLFVSEEHHRIVLDGDIGWILLNGLRKYDLQGLAFYSCGFRNLFYKREQGEEPVTSPEDLYGMKIRVMESPVMVDSINAMGASATPMPASELFQALKTGVVDGAENNPRVFVADKYYEAGCRNFTWTEHFANQHTLIVNAVWFDSLKPVYRQRIKDVVRDIIPQYDKIWADAVDEAIGQMKEYGVVINRIDDKSNFEKGVEPVYESFFEKNRDIPRELFNRIREQAGQCKQRSE